MSDERDPETEDGRAPDGTLRPTVLNVDGILNRAEEMGEYLQDSALCALGATAANPVLTTLRYFRHDGYGVEPPLQGT